VDPVPDPLLLRKSGSAGDRTRDLCICSQKLWPLDHRGGLCAHLIHSINVTVFCKSEALRNVFTLISYLLVETHSASCLFTHSMIYLTLQSWPQCTVSTTSSSQATGLGASHDCGCILEYYKLKTPCPWQQLEFTLQLHIKFNFYASN